MTTVNISLLAGAGWQFFSNDGLPLSGGKLYTYLAGTTTPSPTYTTAAGTIANSNPIILDSAGRVPNEIWLINGTTYKFILKTSGDVVLGTYDNIPGSVSAQDIADIYAAFANTSDITKGDALVGFKQSNATGFLTGAVARTVHQKLQEWVSVKDFGALGNGTGNDTAAIQAALDTGLSVIFPKGIYNVSSNLTVSSNNVTIALLGSTLKYPPIISAAYHLNFTGDNIIFDMGGGVIDQGAGWATVAVNTTPGGSTITVTDGTKFTVGQGITTSWYNPDSVLGGAISVGQYTVQSINGNVLTLSSPMMGAGSGSYLPAGIAVGYFSFDYFVTNSGGGKVTIQNGSFQNVAGYNYQALSSATGYEKTFFFNVDFVSNGTESILVRKRQTVEFSYCTFSKPLDYAKSAFWYDDTAYLHFDNCFGYLGNFDFAVVIAGRDATMAGGELTMSNCVWDGGGGGVAQETSLNFIQNVAPGVFGTISIDSCTIRNFIRYFITDTYDAITVATTINNMFVTNSFIGSSLCYFNRTGGGSITIGKAQYSNVTFAANAYEFAINNANAVHTPTFTNSIFSLGSGVSGQFYIPAYLQGCQFKASEIQMTYNNLQMIDCIFDQTTTITPSPTYSDEFFGTIDRLIIDSTYFPASPGTIFKYQIGASNFNGAVFATAKSVNGSVYYNVSKLNTTVIVSGNFKITNGVYFLKGNDYYIPIGSTITDTYTALTSKVTFSTNPALTATAASGATNLVVSDSTGIAIADKVNVLLDNGLVDTRIVAATWGGVGLTVPITVGLSSQASAGAKTCFFRVV